MIYGIIFGTALLLTIALMSLQALRLRNNVEGLQRSIKWYSIDFVTLKKHISHAVRGYTRPLVRQLVYRLLALYQTAIRHLRKGMRMIINKTLFHYDKENDPQPQRKESSFLNHVKAHKDSLEGQALHDDEPQDNA